MKKKWKFYIWFFQDIFNSHLCSAVINCDQLLKSYEIRQQKINKINNEFYYIYQKDYEMTLHILTWTKVHGMHCPQPSEQGLSLIMAKICINQTLWSICR